MNIIQKFKFLKIYKDTIHQYKDILLKEFNLRIDKINRCYTVINFPPNIQEEIKQYGYYYLDAEVRKFISKVQIFYKDIGLLELVGYSRIDQLDDHNVLIVFEYNKLNTKNLFIIKWISIGLSILALIGLLIWII